MNIMSEWFIEAANYCCGAPAARLPGMRITAGMLAPEQWPGPACIVHDAFLDSVPTFLTLCPLA